MANSYIEKYPSRVKFRPNKQRRFILLIQNKLDANAEDISKIVGTSPRTIRDWRRERINMSFSALKILSRKAKISLPSNIRVLKPFWYTRIGAKAGGVTVLRKYGRIGGDPEYRRARWYEWWNKTGKYRHSYLRNSPLPFHKPGHSKNLAELVGVFIGDGGLTKYQAKITLHHKDDKQYIKFVSNLITKLFRVPIKIHHRPNISVKDIVISRVNLVAYLNRLGLPVGNKIKQNIDIPAWIKENSDYSMACLRGLVDTDGCIFTHRYRVGSKKYSYKKISFATASHPLMKSVKNILKNLEIKPYINKEELRIENQNGVIKYFNIIGSHNPKHLRKYHN
ncbi:MAG: hypothetical protein A3B91_03540 [Candidatus Yanofskybacteria bacterium RIFCSPHIGHO2_02_FULL_41_29]|uniref:DOD-type homing endonuclease domain-containing protein n=1 Tax=Candidatus Yanofskybacteria bacterium RIFCSPHIGHO2_01_FULL_41_53 TaxID=1802663 RepID=A0A1F8ELC9_9BACT|nr:MAG: hypothetical protein A2650_00805 [Candidatus Yanofskybacteria bacterium RIFCSPHIGHO2_01_FULL_41_53]OGN10831.1 MAG: hypothetical protein A3B91_03540 [Candidatus Yanofskybacteria bacterium RIFCSPHIGHO2_02_FULL_41_29]OGN29500.1 MAG: hypothetical protein A3H54_01180 [Candidatus Yanofskybacteria bacterium RIFCSPLOWO2_02_FULL_41_13]